MTAIEHDTPPRNSTTETASFQHDWGGDESLTATIVSTIATLSETGPTDVEVLYDRIDPDALEAIFEPLSDAERDDGHVRFSFAGCEVTVYGDGFVVVRRIG